MAATIIIGIYIVVFLVVVFLGWYGWKCGTKR